MKKKEVSSSALMEGILVKNQLREKIENKRKNKSLHMSNSSEIWNFDPSSWNLQTKLEISAKQDWNLSRGLFFWAHWLKLTVLANMAKCGPIVMYVLSWQMQVSPTVHVVCNQILLTSLWFFQGTQLYDPKAGGWRDLGMLDVMQVLCEITHE